MSGFSNRSMFFMRSPPFVFLKLTRCRRKLDDQDRGFYPGDSEV